MGHAEMYNTENLGEHNHENHWIPYIKPSTHFTISPNYSILYFYLFTERNLHHYSKISLYKPNKAMASLQAPKPLNTSHCLSLDSSFQFTFCLWASFLFTLHLKIFVMAKFNFILAVALVIALVLSHGITSTEGRQLKLQQKSVMSTRNFNFYRRNLDGDSDDFRPTNPGHSPGAGHSNGPSSKP